MDALFEIFKLRYYSLIEESKQSRNFEEKLHKLDQAIKICPIPIEAYYEKATLYYFDKHDFRTALTYFEKAIELSPNRQDYFINVADCFDNLNMPNEVIKACDRSLELVEMNPAITERAYYLKGLSYQNLGDYEQALIWFSEATKKNPQNPKPFLNKASSLSRLKRFKEAIECCNVAIKLDPSLALAYSMKGDAHMFLNEHKHAVEMFTMALKLDPNNSEKLLDLNRARCFLHKLYMNPVDAVESKRMEPCQETIQDHIKMTYKCTGKK